jgi:hypothetical protein
MGLLGTLFFGERKFKPILINLPYQMISAIETVVFLDNAHAREWEKVDRDYVVGIAIAEYLQKKLVDKPNQLPDPVLEQMYTNGRRQSRSY